MSVQDWDNFAVITGGASGALTGLLFVSVSLHPDRIGARGPLRARAAQTLVLFVIPLLLSMLVVIPDQPRTALGIELVVFGLVSGLALGRSGQRAGRADETDEDWLLARLLDRSGSNLVTCAFSIAGGVSLLVGGGGELYWVVPAVVVALITGVLNAWLILLPPEPRTLAERAERAQKRRGPGHRHDAPAAASDGSGSGEGQAAGAGSGGAG